VPGSDAVGFHLFKREVVATDRADAVLPLVVLALLVRRERPDVQVLLLPIQHI
jgi:hypothetical protein